MEQKTKNKENLSVRELIDLEVRLNTNLNTYLRLILLKFNDSARNYNSVSEKINMLILETVEAIQYKIAYDEKNKNQCKIENEIAYNERAKIFVDYFNGELK